jgi:large subunit ribosomal protein L13
MKTFSAKAEEIERRWVVIDADGQVVGRVAERAARLLRGKDKAIFTSHVDCGDHVVIINAEKARFTGKKELDKVYTSFSGYVGGHKSENPQRLRERRPELILERAVKGMIPHNTLGSAIYKKLHVYAGTEHPHAAQNPEPIKL